MSRSPDDTWRPDDLAGGGAHRGDRGVVQLLRRLHGGLDLVGGDVGVLAAKMADGRGGWLPSSLERLRRVPPVPDEKRFLLR
jgi:hypothetical protein